MKQSKTYRSVRYLEKQTDFWSSTESSQVSVTKLQAEHSHHRHCGCVCDVRHDDIAECEVLVLG